MTPDEIKIQLARLLAMPAIERRKLLKEAAEDIRRDPDSPIHSIELHYEQ